MDHSLLCNQSYTARHAGNHVKCCLHGLLVSSFLRLSKSQITYRLCTRSVFGWNIITACWKIIFGDNLETDRYRATVLQLKRKMNQARNIWSYLIHLNTWLKVKKSENKNIQYCSVFAPIDILIHWTMSCWPVVLCAMNKCRITENPHFLIQIFRYHLFWGGWSLISAHVVVAVFPTAHEGSILSLRWPLTAAAPSLHKHGSSMASNSSSDRQRIAQQRLRIIAGHLQKPVDSDSAVGAVECKAEENKTNVSSTAKRVPRRR